MSVNNHRYDVIVVGAGMVGLAFALKLAIDSDIKIAVLERASQPLQNPQPNQRVVALGDAATQLLRQIDVFQQLSQQACYPYNRMFVWDESNDGELSFSASDYQQQSLGYMVDSIELTCNLQQAAKQQSNVDVIYDFHAQSLQFEGETQTVTSDTDWFIAGLIVAADGANSWVRQQAKIFAQRQTYQQKGIVAQIATGEPHQDTAWQVFLDTGPLAILPLNNNHASIVWSADNDRAEALLAMPNNNFENAVANALGQRLGDVNLLSDRQSFDLSSVRAQQYFKQGLALIGDAAHSIHPLAGQGANLGFKDAAALVAVLKNVETNLFGELNVLASYQHMRKADNEQTDALMSALHQAYQSTTPWWLSARGKGMNLIGNSQVLKNILVKQAMGL